MTIKRYEAHTNIDDFKADWHESKDGPMVKFEGYVALAAENAGLKVAIKEIVDSAEEAEYDGYFSFVVNPDAIHAGADLIESETPATDAFLAEVRASGVEMMREHPAIKLCSLTHVCDELAAQLRREASK